jgi:O-antigen/teichoic acid export membrane protein
LVDESELRGAKSRHTLTVSLLVVRALALLTNAAVARLVGKADYGAAGAALAFGSLVAVPLSGVQWAVTRQISTAPSNHYRLGKLCAAVYLAAAAMLLAGLAASGIADSALHLHGVWPSTLLGLFLASVLIEGVPIGVLVGEGRFRYVSGCVLLGAILKIAISVIWGLVHPNVVGPIAGAGLGEFITAMALTVPMVPRLLDRRGTRHVSFREVWLSMAGSTGLLAIMSIDTIAARHWLSGPDSGLYAVASALGSGVFFVSSAAIAARYPDVSRGAMQGQSKAFWLGLLEVSGLAIVACSVLVAGAPLIIRLVFGGQYAGARSALIVLSFSYALLGVLSYLVNHLLAHRTRAILIPWIGTAILTGLVFVRHHTTVAIASDALIASGTIFVVMLAVSVQLERRSGESRGPLASRRMPRRVPNDAT